MNIETLREKFLCSIDLWIEKRINDMLVENPSLAIPSVYMKRGCHNIINKYEKDISKSIDKAALFIADEEGNINTNTLFEDAMSLFRGIEETDFDIGIMQGTIGKGKIAIELPDNLLLNIIFGNRRTITLNEEDFLELKNLLTA